MLSLNSVRSTETNGQIMTSKNVIAPVILIWMCLIVDAFAIALLCGFWLLARWDGNVNLRIAISH